MMRKYFLTERYVVLDSGICLTKANVELKKSLSWWWIDKEEDVLTSFDARWHINEYLRPNQLERWMSWMVEWNWILNELNYIMKMIGTGGASIMEGCKDIFCCKWQDGNESNTNNFTLIKPFPLHFQYLLIFEVYSILHQLFQAVRTLGGLIVGFPEWLHSYLPYLKSTCSWWQMREREELDKEDRFAALKIHFQMERNELDQTIKCKPTEPVPLKNDK